eukprot:8333664-Pyramimonas_sp.AAC.1
MLSSGAGGGGFRGADGGGSSESAAAGGTAEAGADEGGHEGGALAAAAADRKVRQPALPQGAPPQTYSRRFQFRTRSYTKLTRDDPYDETY